MNCCHKTKDAKLDTMFKNYKCVKLAVQNITNHIVMFYDADAIVGCLCAIEMEPHDSLLDIVLICCVILHIKHSNVI